MRVPSEGAVIAREFGRIVKRSSGRAGLSALESEATVRLGEGTEAIGCHLQHVRTGRDCRLINSVVTGGAGNPVVLGDRVTLINCHVQASGQRGAFEFGGWGVDQHATRLADDVWFSHSHLLDTRVEAGSRGTHAVLDHCHVGPRNDLRTFANMTRSRTAADCQLGSEVSKTLIFGAGFVSEHANTYLSLLAPADYPILTEDGREAVLTGLPNVTNIGAGTVFANYGGEPLPACAVEQSPGSTKGTAVVYTSFVGINCRVVNRYGQPQGQPGPFDLLRRRDLTILGFGSFVENKVTGRIPAFAYAGDLSPRSHQLGWVLVKKPGIILNFITKMRRQLGDQSWRLRDLVEGTLRLEHRRLQDELAGGRPGFYTREQLESGLAILQSHLQDRRWSMTDAGDWQHRWAFDTHQQQWVCDVQGW